MRRAVIDASFLYAALADDGAVGQSVLDPRGPELHAPEVVRFEVTEALRKAVIRSRLDESAARSALDVLCVLPIVQWDFRPFADRVWALRSNVSAYDAAYVALAEHLDAPLLTFDRRLARAVGPRCRFIVPG